MIINQFRNKLGFFVLAACFISLTQCSKKSASMSGLSFSSDQWRSCDPETRKLMLSSLLGIDNAALSNGGVFSLTKSYLKNKTLNELLNILGNPDMKTTNPIRLYYNIGMFLPPNITTHGNTYLVVILDENQISESILISN